MKSGTRVASTAIIENLIAQTEHLVSECRLVLQELQEVKQELDSLTRKLPEPAQRNAVEGNRDYGEMKRAG